MKKMIAKAAFMASAMAISVSGFASDECGESKLTN